MTDTQQKVLIADSDEAAAQLTDFYLTQALYETRVVKAADKVVTECAAFSPDLVLLEAIFPGREKLQVCSELCRQSHVPVIILSSESEVSDRVQGLDLGADDYLAKPFDARELLARIRAILRRYHPSEDELPMNDLTGEFVKYPDLTVSLTNYSALYQGETVNLPPKELELLYFMASSPNQVFSREQLLDRLWGFDYMGDTRTVDVHIKRLREKFRSSQYWEIKTVWGVGYKFEVKIPITKDNGKK
ncbi:MAG: response regulator transcription factor [Lachnospiraceae bacterium]|nr:response regulator transcription factor [Lachnospiraceae bacterium]